MSFQEVVAELEGLQAQLREARLRDVDVTAEMKWIENQLKEVSKKTLVVDQELNVVEMDAAKARESNRIMEEAIENTERSIRLLRETLPEMEAKQAKLSKDANLEKGDIQDVVQRFQDYCRETCESCSNFPYFRKVLEKIVSEGYLETNLFASALKTATGSECENQEMPVDEADQSSQNEIGEMPLEDNGGISESSPSGGDAPSNAAEVAKKTFAEDREMSTTETDSVKAGETNQILEEAIQNTETVTKKTFAADQELRVIEMDSVKTTESNRIMEEAIHNTEAVEKKTFAVDQGLSVVEMDEVTSKESNRIMEETIENTEQAEVSGGSAMFSFGDFGDNTDGSGNFGMTNFMFGMSTNEDDGGFGGNGAFFNAENSSAQGSFSRFSFL